MSDQSGDGESDHTGSNDRRERPTPAVTRRKMVESGTVTAAALAGCTGLRTDPGTEKTGDGPESPSPTPPETVHDKTLGDHLDDAGDGDVSIELPAGVTEFEPPAITRAASIELRGAGKHRTVLRATSGLSEQDYREADVERDDRGRITDGHLPRFFYSPSEPAPGADFVLGDLTIDMQNQPSDGRWLIFLAKRGRFLLEHLRVTGFDFDQQRLLATSEQYRENDYQVPDGLLDQNRTPRGIHVDAEEVLFRDVTIDFADVTNRNDHNYHLASVAADRFEVDDDCHFVGNTDVDFTQPKNEPPFDPGHPEEIRGFHPLEVRDEGVLNGLFQPWEQYALRGGPANEDARVEVGCTVRDIGNGDLFDGRNAVGELVFDGVTIEGHMDAPGAIGDRGLGPFRGPTPGEGRTDLTIRDCTVHGPLVPIHVGDGGFTGSVDIEDVDLKGGSILGRHEGIILPHLENPKIDDVTIRGATITGDTTLGEYFGDAIVLKTEGDRNGGWFDGATVTVEDVEASNFLGEIVRDDTPDHVTVTTSNLRGEQTTEVPIPDDVDVGIIPQDSKPYGAQDALPGIWTGDGIDEAMSVANGDPSVDHGGGGFLLLGYDVEAGFNVLYWLSDDDKTTPSGGDPSTADHVRLGLAPGAPGEADEWIEVHVAAPSGMEVGDDWAEPATAAYRHPDGEPIDVAVDGRVRLSDDGRWRSDFVVPWNETGIDPATERCSVDLAFVDVDSGGEQGTLQFLGRSGVLDEKSTSNFKHAALLGAGRSGDDKA